MSKILKSKGWTLAAVLVALVMLISGVLVAMRFYVRMNLYDTPASLLEGKYSVDGGEWKELKADQAITDHFHKIEIRGTLSENVISQFRFEEISITTKDVWFELSTTDVPWMRLVHFRTN